MTSKIDKAPPVIEIFGPTLQGEGALCGTFTHFIRLAGCTYRCNWCDSMYAVDPKEIAKNRRIYTINEVINILTDLERKAKCNIPWVTISGGDPMIHKNLHYLVKALQKHGWKVSIETQGAIYNRLAAATADLITISPKPPSSGEFPNWKVVHQYIQQVDIYCIKVVIDPRNDADMEYLRNVFIHIPRDDAIYIQSVTPLQVNCIDILRTEIALGVDHLFKRIMEPKFDLEQFLYRTIIIPQMHSIYWGNKPGV